MLLRCGDVGLVRWRWDLISIGDRFWKSFEANESLFVGCSSTGWSKALMKERGELCFSVGGGDIYASSFC